MIYEFDPEQIVKGSGYISSQCRGSSEIELGMYEVSEVNRTVKCLELKKEMAFLKKWRHSLQRKYRKADYYAHKAKVLGMIEAIYHSHKGVDG